MVGRSLVADGTFGEHGVPAGHVGLERRTSADDEEGLDAERDQFLHLDRRGGCADAEVADSAESAVRPVEREQAVAAVRECYLLAAGLVQPVEEVRPEADQYGVGKSAVGLLVARSLPDVGLGRQVDRCVVLLL